MRNKLKFFRVEARLTRSMVAGAVGVSLPVYQRLEDGQVPLANRKLRKLAKVLRTTPEAILDKHPPLEMAMNGIDTPDDERLTYYGEVAFHFSGGGKPLLLSISEAAFHDLHDQLQQSAAFVSVETLANRTVVVRTDAIADTCFSSDAYDDVDVDGRKYSDYPDHISIQIPDPRDWEIIEVLGSGIGLEHFDRADVQRVSGIVTGPTDYYERLVAEGRFAPEEIPAERERINNTSDLIHAAAHCIEYQLSAGARRRVYSCEPATLYEAFQGLVACDATSYPGDLIALPAEGRDRSIFINSNALDYVALPTHRYIKGATEFHAKRLDALEPAAKSARDRTQAGVPLPRLGDMSARGLSNRSLKQGR